MSDHTTPARENEQVEYREIPGHLGYLVGSDGTVWSRRRRACGGLREEMRQLKPCRHRNGYLTIFLGAEPGGKKNLSRRRSVHHLVLLTFIGPPPEGTEACHEDGDRTNNRVSNLRWDTRKNNHADKIKHGTLVRGEAHPRAKLTEADVLSIRRRLAAGEFQSVLGREYGVHQSIISDIKRRERWGHIPEDTHKEGGAT